MSFLTPLASLRVTRHLIPAHGHTPNTSLQRKPLMIYHSAFDPSAIPSSSSSLASALETHVRSVGVVAPQWRYTMYSTSHFHSTTHEVLCICDGNARLLFGGEDNDGKVVESVSAGDVIIIPAGVAHRLWEDQSGNFEMVGCYPVSAKSWDMCYGKESEKSATEGIKQLGWFDRDPIYGSEGPVLDV